MTRKQALSSSTRLSLAILVAGGLAAAPLTAGSGIDSPVKPNAATAQAQAGDQGFAQEQTERRLDPQARAAAETVYDILGTTREKAEGTSHQLATAQYGPLESYQTEVERNNLDAAADTLAKVAERPITEKMVTDVHTELGIETDLAAAQIADVAASKQGMLRERSDARTGDTVLVVTQPAAVAVPESADDRDAIATGERIAEMRSSFDSVEDYNYDQDTIYGLLGTSREEAESQDSHTMATAQYGQLQAYQTAVERGNLAAAADNLAAVADRPITQPMVNELNTRLGLDTRLTNQQIADAAARIQNGER